MTDQSAAVDSSALDKIKASFLLDPFQVLKADFESLKVFTRNPDCCKELANALDFLERLSEFSFQFDKIDTDLRREAMKGLINIATNEVRARNVICEVISEKLSEILSSEALEEEDLFLLGRFMFLLSIDLDGATRLASLADYANSRFSVPFDDDSSLSGKILIDILRFRYNQVLHGLIDCEMAVRESSEIICKCRVSEQFVNILGTALNVSIGRGREEVLFAFDTNVFLNVLQLLMNLFASNTNKDYLGSALAISVSVCASNENLRGHFRRRLLPSQNGMQIKILQQLLMTTDTSVSFLIGELLLGLCKGNVSRLIRHLGLGSCAGYLYRKGLFKDGSVCSEDVLDPSGESSDEEYFLSHPLTIADDEHTPLVPETEEEERELEYLMQKITEYNSKTQKQ